VYPLTQVVDPVQVTPPHCAQAAFWAAAKMGSVIAARVREYFIFCVCVKERRVIKSD
jgi:hypothetical protein